MEYRTEWLRSFVAVAEHGGFSAAAAALYRSQSRVSAHVAALEKALHVKLFDRTLPPTVLTPEGRELLPLAGMVLRQTRRITETAAEVRRGRRGEVRLGICTGAAPFLLPRTLMWLRRVRPDVRVETAEDTTAALRSQLREGRLDLAVVPVSGDGEDAEPLLGWSRLWREQFVVVAAGDVATELPARLSPAELRGRPLVMTDDAADALAGVLPGAGRAGRASLPSHDPGRPPAVLRTPQAQTVVALVRLGCGVGVADLLALHATDLTDVTSVRLTGTPTHREMALGRRTDRADSPALRAVARCVRLAALPAAAAQSRSGAPSFPAR
ncbi:LysR family transcriptional regulator [Streptomyces thinghirensis]|uniref:LysR family transcriptional regulator n=1 Tax=Streptomyces thinghirensis TaxID=551547 RepID=UPI0031F15666